MNRSDDLARIAKALAQAAEIARSVSKGDLQAQVKAGGDPVTKADLEINDALRAILPQPGEGWLSEETKDSDDRLDKKRVWIVDPLDGTKEFIQQIPEYAISICLVEDGRPVAGGICNPATNELIMGSLETGVTLNGRPVSMSSRTSLGGARVLASRSEVKRGQWKIYEGKGFEVVPMGSVAYKLARVAAGLEDATWTLDPKNEWDIAAGVALVQAAGGEIWVPGDRKLLFNQKDPLFPGVIAGPKSLLFSLFVNPEGREQS